jgi:sugar lactone lactonase YvrE
VCSASGMWCCCYDGRAAVRRRSNAREMGEARVKAASTGVCCCFCGVGVILFHVDGGRVIVSWESGVC